jgi:predicted small secreted protein
MKKTIVIACALLLVMSVAACNKGGGGKYADVKKVFGKYIDATEKFATTMEGVKSADEVVKAIEAYTLVAKELGPQIKGFEAKYPEFKNMENPPEELKPLVDRMTAVATKMMGSMGKIAEFASDPKVQEAQTKMNEAMAAVR